TGVQTCALPIAYGVALADRFADHVLEGLVGGGRDRGCERAAELAVGRQGCVEQHAEADLAEELRFRRLLEYVEARGDIGLERKMMQQPRGEGVDGLPRQSARRLQRHREQPPRQGAPRRVRLDI